MSKFNSLGGYDAVMKSLSKSIITKKRIFTTLSRGKALRGFLEPILTKVKDGSTHSRRVVFSFFQDKNIVKELFNNISEKILSRNGGYLRVIKTGYRVGDNAAMCMVEMVDYNSIYKAGEVVKNVDNKPKTRRGKKKMTRLSSI